MISVFLTIKRNYYRWLLFRGALLVSAWSSVRRVRNRSENTIWFFSVGGPGIHDPCEREPTDVLRDLGAQQADTITDSAQVSPVLWFPASPSPAVCVKQRLRPETAESESLWSWENPCLLDTSLQLVWPVGGRHAVAVLTTATWNLPKMQSQNILIAPRWPASVKVINSP